VAASSGPLKWVFELLDRVSGPAKRMETALTRAEAALRRNTQALASAGAGAGRFRQSLDALNLDAFLNIASRVGSALRGIGEYFGKTVVGSLAMKESTLASFEMILGTKEAAKDLFDEAAKMAKLTPFGTQDVVDAYSGLLAAGFKRDEVTTVFQGLSDISALSDFDPAGMKAIALQLAQMKGLGKVTMADLKPILSVSSKAGIGMEAIYGELAKEIGTSPQAVAAMEGGGQISADRFIYAFMQTIANKGGGAVGKITERQSETLRGLWSNFQSIPTDVIFGFAENMKGVDALKGALKTVIKLFDSSTVVGKRFQQAMERITDSLLRGIFGPFQGNAGDLFFQEKMESFLAWAEGVDWGAAFRDLGTTLQGIGNAAMYVAKAINAIGTAFGTTGKWLGEAAGWVSTLGDRSEKDLYNAALANGKKVREGLAAGTYGAHQDAAVTAQKYAAGFAGPQGIDAHSPSRVFEELGRFSAMGYAQGLSAGMPGVARSLGEMASPGAASGSQKGAGGTVHIHEGAFPIVVQGGSGDPEELARQLRPALLETVTSIFEGLGMEVGAEGAT